MFFFRKKLKKHTLHVPFFKKTHSILSAKNEFNFRFQADWENSRLNNFFQFLHFYWKLEWKVAFFYVDIFDRNLVVPKRAHSAWALKLFPGSHSNFVYSLKTSKTLQNIIHFKIHSFHSNPFFHSFSFRIFFHSVYFLLGFPIFLWTTYRKIELLDLMHKC